ncbi:helix-turn-helix domain-containing protein [Limnohabitans sp.]|jgi:transcriptional regulator with XRE-family HTH domain|uniref:helix-turn-helix domain-containing protein n=1 Tax=Limnohabitans sp. TaxID=1907725 RepID=UPI0037C0A31D
MPRKTSLYPNAPELSQLGAAIRKARKEAGISQETLAHTAEIERSYFGAIERGEVNVTFMNLVKVSRELGVPLANLLADARL